VQTALLYNMPAVCVVGGCGSTYGVTNDEEKVAMFSWPSGSINKQKWDSFVKSTRKEWVSGNARTVMCNKHFTKDCFIGHMQWKMGFRRQLSLKVGAVPTIPPKPKRCQESASAAADGYESPKRNRTALTMVNLRWVWMNLQVTNTEFVQAKPLKLVDTP